MKEQNTFLSASEKIIIGVGFSYPLILPTANYDIYSFLFKRQEEIRWCQLCLILNVINT